MNDCIFCKIVAGKLPSTKIYEDDRVLGIKDIAPVSPIHYLFIPKQHFSSLLEVQDLSIIQDLHSALIQTAKLEGVSERGFRTVINTGEEGGQTVFHLHLHLLAGRPLSARMS